MIYPVLAALIVSLSGLGLGEEGRRTKLMSGNINRSFQVAQAPEEPPGLQYYTTGPMYAAISSVLIPNQIGLSPTPTGGVILPPAANPKPSEEFPEASTQSSRIFHNHKPRNVMHGSKRPSSYSNSLYGASLLRMSPMSHLQLSSFGVQPAVEVGERDLSSTVVPTIGSTYGPAKAVDFHRKTRGPGGQILHHRVKGSTHRHHLPKKMRVYNHIHKDHMHSHYLPVNNAYKPGKYAAPKYLPPIRSTSSGLLESTAVPAYPFQTVNPMRFPEVTLDGRGATKAPGDVTQAIVKTPGVINNYDASIPIQVPNKKPYQFEIKEILKNSDVHFIEDGRESGNEGFNSNQNNLLLRYRHKVPQQGAIVFHQPIYAHSNQVLPAGGPLDMFSLTNTYQSNHIVPDQDLGASETVKVPVAIIRGAHDIASQGIFGFTMKRQDDEASFAGKKKDFAPSRRTSDWVPMSGSGVPLSETRNGNPESEPLEAGTGRRAQTGDIISGKMSPEDAPLPGAIPFVSTSSVANGKRKGSVLDVYPSSSSGETSDMVVSSVIKFS